MEKSCRTFAPKASPRPLFYLGKESKKAIAWKKLFIKIRYLGRELSKTFKKVNFIFPVQSSPFQWTKLSKIKEACN